MRHAAPEQKGFTLLETIVVLVVLGILSAMAVVSFEAVSNRTREGETRATVQAVIATQVAYEQTRGSFTEDPAALQNLDSSYEYAGRSEESTGTNSVSVAVGALAGEEIVGAAALSSGGKCVTLRSASRDSALENTHGSFAAGTRPCTGEQALLEEALSW